MSSDEKLQVKSFLLSMKLLLQKSSKAEPRWTFSTVRGKNMDTLANLEIKVEDVKDIILSLTPMDYCRGPLKDRTIEGDLWEFGKKAKGRDVYIKLKLSGYQHSQMVRVLSFHFPEMPLKYYFKEKGRGEIKIK